MSSILRALKKIQTDGTAPPGIQAGPGMSPSGKPHGRLYMYIGLLGAAVVFGIAFGSAWVFQHTPRPQPEIARSEKGTAENGIPAKKDSGLRGPKDENSARIRFTPERKEEISSPGPSVSGLPGPSSVAGVPVQISGNPDMPAEDHGQEDIQPLEEAASERIISPDAETMERRIIEKYQEIDESAGLDLQAISWAADPQKRLAVINGMLCRENESVKGFTIKQINPDDVVVSKGTVTGKLVLKIR